MLLTGGSSVAMEENAQNGTTVELSVINDGSFFETNGWYQNSAWTKSTSGMPQIACEGEGNSSVALEPIEIMPAPDIDQYKCSAGMGNSEARIAVTASVASSCYIVWAVAETGTTPGELTYSDKDADGNKIFAMDTSVTFQIQVPDRSKKYDIYLKTVSMDGEMLHDNKKAVLKNIAPQIFDGRNRQCGGAVFNRHQRPV